MEKRQLSHSDIIEALRRATNSYQGAEKRWQERASRGLTDEQLEEALAYELGTAGGSGGRDILSIEYSRSGLKIWASWDSTNSYRDSPVLEGKRTMMLAREIYGIADPTDMQRRLF